RVLRDATTRTRRRSLDATTASVSGSTHSTVTDTVQSVSVVWAARCALIGGDAHQAEKSSTSSNVASLSPGSGPKFVDPGSRNASGAMTDSTTLTMESPTVC